MWVNISMRLRMPCVQEVVERVSGRIGGKTQPGGTVKIAKIIEPRRTT